MRILCWLAATAAIASTTFAAPLTRANKASYPVAIWHGLGDRYDSPGLAELADDIRNAIGPATLVHMIRTNNDSNADQKETLFGKMDSMLSRVADQLKDLEDLKDGFDAIGLSQGGVFLRGYIERYGSDDSYPKVRNLITLGSPHMGISSAPPCKPTDFFCKATQWALRTGVWTPYAQNGVVPAQYFRNQAKIDEYLSHDSFLKDINNERASDDQPHSGAGFRDLGELEKEEPRNETYKTALTSINNFVTFAFDQDMTVIPWTSTIFTLPTADDPSSPLPYEDLPLYEADYIGLRELREKDGFHQRSCHGQHMQIGKKCWNEVISWLGENGEGRGARPDSTPALLVQT